VLASGVLLFAEDAGGGVGVTQMVEFSSRWQGTGPRLVGAVAVVILVAEKHVRTCSALGRRRRRRVCGCCGGGFGVTAAPRVTAITAGTTFAFLVLVVLAVLVVGRAAATAAAAAVVMAGSR